MVRVRIKDEVVVPVSIKCHLGHAVVSLAVVVVQWAGAEEWA